MPSPEIAAPTSDNRPLSKAEARAMSFARKIDKSDPEYRITKALENLSSRQMPDPFNKDYGSSPGVGPLRIIEPAVPLDSLSKLPQENGMLAACIDAMKTNIESFGFTLVFVGKDEQKESAEALAEKEWIEDFLNRVNADESITQVREKLRMDLETFGHGYLEMGRDLDGNPLFCYQVPAQSMRVTSPETDPTEVKIWIKRGGKLEAVPMDKYFRRYVQRKWANAEKVFFKEIGDPREISSKTGQVKDDGILPEDELATEMIWINRYSPGFVYGLPRFIAQIAAILGSKEAELVNLNFFKDNAIPALAVLVAGAMLSEEAISNIKDTFENKKGRQSINRCVVLEARTPQEEQPLDGSAPPVPRLDIKPLAQERQGDALFQNYLKQNGESIRMAFKLPPLLVGLSQDYTRATAEASLEMAEALVFGPERTIIDNIVNDKLLTRQGKPPVFWKYKSNPPKIASAEAKIKAIEGLNNAGGITPNIVRSLLNELFGLNLEIIEEPWGDLPVDFTQSMIDQGLILPDTGFPEAPPEPEPGGGTSVGEPPHPGKGRRPFTQPAGTKDDMTSGDLSSGGGKLTPQQSTGKPGKIPRARFRKPPAE